MSILNRNVIVSRCLVFLMILFFSFNLTVSAAIVTTLQITKPIYSGFNSGGFNSATQSGQSNEFINLIATQNITRSNLEQQLVTLGVEPEHVHNRLNSMTDAEISVLVSELSQLPAGGDALTTIAFVFLVLLFTDIAGYTDLFPFVKKVSRKNDTQHDGQVIDRRVDRKQNEPIVIEN